MLRDDVERAGPSLRETAFQGLINTLSVMKDAAMLTFPELSRAASLALGILEIVEAVKDNKDGYKRLAEDSGGLVIAIERLYDKDGTPNTGGLSAGMEEALENLTRTLQDIFSFGRAKLTRGIAMRTIHSRSDVGKIQEYRERLNSAVQGFSVLSQIDLHKSMRQLMRQLDEETRHRNNEDDTGRALEISVEEAGVQGMGETGKITQDEVVADTTRETVVEDDSQGNNFLDNPTDEGPSPGSEAPASPLSTPPRSLPNRMTHHPQDIGSGNGNGGIANPPLGSPMYFPHPYQTSGVYLGPWGPQFPASWPGGVVITTGVGNTTITNISNVNNDNSRTTIEG